MGHGKSYRSSYTTFFSELEHFSCKMSKQPLPAHWWAGQVQFSSEVSGKTYLGELTHSLLSTLQVVMVASRLSGIQDKLTDIFTLQTIENLLISNPVNNLGIFDDLV